MKKTQPTKKDTIDGSPPDNDEDFQTRAGVRASIFPVDEPSSTLTNSTARSSDGDRENPDEKRRRKRRFRKRSNGSSDSLETADRNIDEKVPCRVHRKGVSFSEEFRDPEKADEEHHDRAMTPGAVPISGSNTRALPSGADYGDDPLDQQFQHDHVDRQFRSMLTAELVERSEVIQAEPMPEPLPLPELTGEVPDKARNQSRWVLTPKKICVICCILIVLVIGGSVLGAVLINDALAPPPPESGSNNGGGGENNGGNGNKNDNKGGSNGGNGN